jgi:hypothetical protein
VPTEEEEKREKRINPYFESNSRRVNRSETSGEDGRFQIRGVVSGAKFHLRIIMNPAARRLGPKAPADQGEKLLCETTLTADQALDLGDVRILPEELRGDPSAAVGPPLAR